MNHDIRYLYFYFNYPSIKLSCNKTFVININPLKNKNRMKNERKSKYHPISNNPIHF